MSTSTNEDKVVPKESYATVMTEKAPSDDVSNGNVVDVTAGSQALHRKLKGPEVQLFAIGGAIGTSLYVQMGSALPKGGPIGLLLAFLIWGAVMWCVNECFAEMVTYVPVTSPFIRFGSEWVDGALGFAMSWNFFLNMAFLVPFEIAAMNLMFGYWTDKVPVIAVIVVMIVLYGLLNVISVRYFGIAEFYLSIFKVLLMLGLFMFTFITMVGGNPIHDKYGFRYWTEPGPFENYLVPGGAGIFCGILSCIYQASFSICGPEYISVVAAETENPRKVLPAAFRSFVWRILLFFVGSALCMGIVVASNDETLLTVLSSDKSSTGAASPYVIAMQRLHVSEALASIVNALIMTSIFSAGNGLLFAATRTLHGMALEGHAPRFFGKCTNAGVPIYALFFSLSICLLAFLQVNNSSYAVIGYLIGLVTACQLLNYGATAVVYRHFYAALQKQGISRDTLPYKGRFQPYTSYVAMFGTAFMLLASGYNLFLTGGWDLKWFFLTYSMIGFFVVLFIGWKLWFKTTYVRPGTADISIGGLKDEIDEYEALYMPRPRGKVLRLLGKVFD
ncbi:General amino acid permease AGP2 [Cyphellophora attinorum]|uniref:General amino acid permease AGP2 n=1 Tax=Cyphellophora attinorum TaxID=1664694 RepID=A0A0N0NS47_9EURO|nr:General amino acid permease AGP2 [Phialophora attinorum]KPI45838.1 General amino acid permease AGP2 [Phialophora attinorum]